MQLTRLLLVAALGLGAPLGSVALAQTEPAAEAPAEALAEALQLSDLFAVLREEGIAYGASLEESMFPGDGGAQWSEAVSRIYDVAALRSQFEAVLAAGLADDPAALTEILAFYASPTGEKAVRLEIDARRTFLDEAAEEAARVAADDRVAARDPKVPLLRRFIEAGDLVEMNVAGGLSGNLAFLTGLSETGVYGQAMPEEDLMSEVWSQEEQIRSDTTSWLYAYLGLAYEPLTEAEFQDYIDFMESSAGRKLNAALFAAFEQVFRSVSYELGRAAGVAMQGNDI